MCIFIFSLRLPYMISIGLLYDCFFSDCLLNAVSHSDCCMFVYSLSYCYMYGSSPTPVCMCMFTLRRLMFDYSYCCSHIPSYTDLSQCQVSEVELTIQKQIESDRPSKQDSSCSHYTHLLRIRLGNSSIMKGTVALETSVIWTDGDETVRWW